MSARTVVEHALTVYYDGDRELARKLIENLLAEHGREKDTRGGSPQQGESTPDSPRPHALPEASFAHARQLARLSGFFRCARIGRAETAGAQ